MCCIQSNSMNDTAIGKFAQDNSGTENELPAMDSTKVGAHYVM